MDIRYKLAYYPPCDIEGIGDYEGQIVHHPALWVVYWYTGHPYLEWGWDYGYLDKEAALASVIKQEGRRY